VTQGRQPTVSWLVCADVASDGLRRAIDSCLDQTFTDFEVVVVVNGPHCTEVDATVQGWYRANSCIRIISTAIRHLTFSLNLGVHSARADLIARLDSDDAAYPERLAKQVAFMQSHPRTAVLGSAYDLIDGSGKVVRRVKMPVSNTAIRRALVRGYALCHPSVMFRRQVVVDAGGYFGGVHGQDYELWSRLALNPSIEFENLSEALIGYSVSPTGTARRARSAYATVAAAQWRNFAVGAGMIWAAAALWTVMKAMVVGRRTKR
jgi:glycosyltransferase involved in cell wall biosynthesis